MSELHLPLLLAASLACGVMIGVERGWRLRGEASGTRVAGVRTYSLLGGGGGLAALLGALINPAITALLILAMCTGLVIAYWRNPTGRDATSFVAALIALALGLSKIERNLLPLKNYSEKNLFIR